MELFAVVCYFLQFFSSLALKQYDVSDDLGFGRIFDGIGAISGGGSTSKLLVNYKEPQRSQILDYLFKPKFGASLQILKVEIGGDDQSAGGTQASHMHEEWEENYQRGYEWWLMKEAKKRNPNIKLYGLSWAFPHWLANGNNEPYGDLSKTAMYTVKWILGAKIHHNLTIDYIGIWNEKKCDLGYIIELKKALLNSKLDNVKIVACDGEWSDMASILSNKTAADSTSIIGVHYPGTTSPPFALNSSMTLWSSEDYSTFNDNTGAGCWARILNQNYVNGFMTSTISWTLIASYYFGLWFEGDGLMTAVEPWGGFYEVKNPIWVSAHTTQFTEIGWRYLQHGHGVGLLKNGGSFVALAGPNSENLTLVIETMTHNHSVCIRPTLPAYNVTKQKAIFKFGGSFAKLKQLFLWQSKLGYDGKASSMFKYIGPVEIIQNRVALNLDVDSLFTLTTLTNGKKGHAGPIPKSMPFILPYEDSFQSYALYDEPNNMPPQLGSWEILKDEKSGRKFARQTVMVQPVSWCSPQPYPFAIIGDYKWTDLNITAKMRWPDVNATQRIFVATQVRYDECKFDTTTGYFFWLDLKLSTYTITNDMMGKTILHFGLLKPALESNKWYAISLSVKNSTLTVSLDRKVVGSLRISAKNTVRSGFAGIGSSSYGYSDISYLLLSQP